MNAMRRAGSCVALATAMILLSSASPADAKRKPAADVQKPVAPVDLAALEEAISAQRLTQAKTMLEQAQLARQSGVELNLLKAEYDQASGHPELALAGFKLLIADPGMGPRANQGAGIAAIRLGQVDEALGYLAAAAAADPRLWRAWNALGVAHDLKGHWQAAESAYAQGLAAAPNAGELLANRGYSRLLQKRFADAVADLRQARARLSGNDRIETNLRLALALSGDYEDAIGVSARDPDLVRRLNNAGYAAWLRGDLVAARAYLNRAMELSDVYYDRAANNLAAVDATGGTGK